MPVFIPIRRADMELHTPSPDSLPDPYTGIQKIGALVRIVLSLVKDLYRLTGSGQQFLRSIMLELPDVLE
jgi:hypothetical protein